MKVTFNLRSGVGPITVDLPGDEDEILAEIKTSIDDGGILDLRDVKGDRVIIPSSAIGYVLAPTTHAARVGFGRA